MVGAEATVYRAGAARDQLSKGLRRVSEAASGSLDTLCFLSVRVLWAMDGTWKPQIGIERSST
jgi:hypothetical protein